MGSLAFTVVGLWMFFFQNPTLDYGEEPVKEVNPPGEAAGVIVEEEHLPAEDTGVALEEGDLNGEAGDDLLEHPAALGQSGPADFSPAGSHNLSHHRQGNLLRSDGADIQTNRCVDAFHLLQGYPQFFQGFHPLGMGFP